MVFVSCSWFSGHWHCLISRQDPPIGSCAFSWEVKFWPAGAPESVQYVRASGLAFTEAEARASIEGLIEIIGK